MDKVEGILLDNLRNDRDKDTDNVEQDLPGIDTDDIIIDEDGVIIE